MRKSQHPYNLERKKKYFAKYWHITFQEFWVICRMKNNSQKFSLDVCKIYLKGFFSNYPFSYYKYDRGNSSFCLPFLCYSAVSQLNHTIILKDQGIIFFLIIEKCFWYLTRHWKLSIHIYKQHLPLPLPCLQTIHAVSFCKEFGREIAGWFLGSQWTCSLPL